ncbi:MAG: secondary thiamine-phosphate synthase enzyme YjbQ [Candidatus Omnitrophica bacterium]|nr:secondary thiamine-phosphate synthase enzyme YjbQ [Candidatus Omnitrophota bacterium]
METIQIITKRKDEFVDITKDVSKILNQAGIDSGICIIYCTHTTAGLTINENADPSVKKDIINYLNKAIPEGEGYSHIEGNSDSHIKASIFGSSLNVIVEGGRLVLGTWQGIYFCEFDGPRSREVCVKIIKG